MVVAEQVTSIASGHSDGCSFFLGNEWALLRYNVMMCRIELLGWSSCVSVALWFVPKNMFSVSALIHAVQVD